MAQLSTTAQGQASPPPRATGGGFAAGRFVVALAGLIVVGAFLWFGFEYLKGSTETSVVSAIFAIVWGVGGVAALFTVLNMLIESLPNRWRGRLLPFLFFMPATIILFLFLTIPALITLYQSFFNQDTTRFVGLSNYLATFTDRSMLESFRNNLFWLFIGTGFSVGLGLLIAVLADRSRFETVAKAIVFVPMAISLVGASVIWRFVYAFAPAGQPQIGALNAIITGWGFAPQPWLTLQPWNNLFLILVMIWSQTGFATVLFSAALKGVPVDLVEAARVDGANEFQAFFRIIMPQIQGTLLTVTTTIAIGTLKIFDVVYVMTGGQYGTSVVGTEFFRQFFTNRNFGYGAAIAIVLFIAISPVLVYNLRQLNKQEGFR
jgi:alpha-glucoside transport system permease protein